MQFLQFMAALSLLVVIHEFGHFIAAKIFGVRVEKFYLFFDPGFSLVKFKPKRSETEYGIGWLPFGGYVKLAGMIDESLDTEQMARPAQPWEFRSKPAWQRLIIMFAGVFMNFVLAIVVYAMMLFSYGQQYVALEDAPLGMEFSEVALRHGFCDGDRLLTADGEALERFDAETMRRILRAHVVVVERNGERVAIEITDRLMADMIEANDGFMNFRIPFVVDSVVNASAAARAGLLSGDSLVSLNGTPMVSQPEFSEAFRQHAQDTVWIGVSRSGQLLELPIVPDADGKVGVWLKPFSALYPTRTQTYGFFESIPAGIVQGYRELTGYASDMKWVFTKEGASSVGGFGSIAGLFPDSFNARHFWMIVAYLSVILAFMNVLPIPALDGGHILFLLIECVTGHRFSTEFMIRVQQVGLLLLFALLLYANGMDLFRWLFK
ncbi:MAG: RIP metalloprotease RseP [Paludibacteraceae bacterium]|nr:RIP metalloprotease RseP [Paludibacteraceae bacterium]